MLNPLRLHAQRRHHLSNQLVSSRGSTRTVTTSRVGLFEHLVANQQKKAAENSDRLRQAAENFRKHHKVVTVASQGGTGSHSPSSSAAASGSAAAPAVAPKGEIAVDTSTIDPTWRLVQALKTFPHAPEGDPFVAARIGGDAIVGLNEPLIEALLANNATSSSLASGDDRPLRIELLPFSSLEGKKIFWHSAAHVLGASLEAELGPNVQLCDGPPLTTAEGGFFYECHLIPPSSPTPAAGSLLSMLASSKGGGSLTDAAIPLLEKKMKQIAKEKAPFQRLAVTAEEAAELFQDNPFKLQMLSNIPRGEAISLYRCGSFVDLCRGPHVPHTGLFKALSLYRIAGSHWNGPLPKGLENSEVPPLLQRVYGVAFPSTHGLTDWKEGIEEAKRRDHRVIGRAQQLFFFHEMSPGSAFFLPHGTRIYNRLVSLLRDEYRKRGYEEVMSPLLYKRELWNTSGHLQAYASDMFSVRPGIEPLPSQSPPQKGDQHHHQHQHSADGKCCPPSASSAGPAATAAKHDEEEEVFGLKPMNCPGHCLIFKHRAVSYRELPMRLADFSSLHRNEATGALGGLTRLRRFQQDDAHIFCTLEQVADEVEGCLSFIAHIYRIFGFSFRAKLSTRPETFVGDVETWDSAEKALGDSLKRFLVSGPASAPSSGDAAPENQQEPQFEIDVGGGAFYGPKIDVFVRDAIGREHQCATVQLDFNLPRRFDLHYADDAAKPVTPVMIHRAILGSVERMLGILIEHTGGKWPFWLSPRQLMVCSVSERNAAYANRVAAFLMKDEQAVMQAASAQTNTSGGSSSAGAVSSACSPEASSTSLFVDVDNTSRTIPKKVREAQVSQYNLIAVVGDAEEKDGTVTLRFRDEATWKAFSRASMAAGASKSEGEGGTKKAQDAALPTLTLPLDEAKRLCLRVASELL